MTNTHPRPQLARADWVSLNGEWRFKDDPDDRGRAERWFVHPDKIDGSIVVPYPPESPMSGVGQDVSSSIWYARELSLGPVAEGRRRILHFEAVDYRCNVWLNGQHVAAHEGGQTRFSVDLTDVWCSGSNTLVVCATDEMADIEQPRGKQDWLPEPHGIWYARTSGIWRTVWTEDVPTYRIESVTWTPRLPWGRLDVEMRFAGDRAELAAASVELVFSHDGRRLAASSHALTDRRLVISVSLMPEDTEADAGLLQWSPENPQLIDVTATLTHPSGVDVVQSYLGLRTVRTERHNVLLNEKPYFLRLVLEQLYWPESHLASPSEEALRREVELIKALGFNGIRAHQVVADPRFLYWCDRLGVVVCVDSAATYRFSSVSLSRTTREWIDIVERDKNHPSVVMWVPFNESWGVPAIETEEAQRWAVTAIHGLLKALDPTRIVAGNDGWEFVAGDIVGIHDYCHDSSILDSRYRDPAAVDTTIASWRPSGLAVDLTGRAGAVERIEVPAVLSEFGGVSLAATGSTWEGYGQVETTEEFLSLLADLVGAVGPSSGLVGFCYTQLTDTRQEQNGLLDEQRRPKAEVEQLARIFSGH